MQFTLNLILDLWMFYHMKSENQTQTSRCFSRLALGAFPWASQWVIVLPPHCVQHPGSWWTFISIQQQGTSLLLPSTFMHTTCQMFVWVCSPSVAPLSPGLYHLSHTHESSLVCGNTDIPPLKTNKYDGSVLVIKNNFFLFFFPLPTTYSLCWVTHGCRLFKKPSAWIYIPTLRSLVSQHDWQHNGEGWVSEEAHRT